MNRTQIINFFIKKYNFKSYLEIGIQDKTVNFNHIQCDKRIGVDPLVSADATHCMTSDEFFMINADDSEAFDFIFIDGDHRCEQVDKDINNALNILTPNGIIMCHDCLPDREEHQFKSPVVPHWNGDVWTSIVKLRITRPDLYVATINSDCGCGIVKRGKQDVYISVEDIYTWEYYMSNRIALMNVVEVSELNYI